MYNVSNYESALARKGINNALQGSQCMQNLNDDNKSEKRVMKINEMIRFSISWKMVKMLIDSGLH